MTFWKILLGIFLTAFIYLIFPISYRLFSGTIDARRAKKYALINSIVCAAIFVIIGVLSKSEPYRTMFAPAVAYYFIAKYIFTGSQKKQDINIKYFPNETSDNNSSNDIDEEMQTEENTENCETRIVANKKEKPQETKTIASEMKEWNKKIDNQDIDKKE